MMNREVSLIALLSAVAWALGARLVAASFVPALPSGLGAAGVFVAVVAAAVAIQGWFVNLQEREVAAFNLGRESVRSPSPLTRSTDAPRVQCNLRPGRKRRQPTREPFVHCLHVLCLVLQQRERPPIGALQANVSPYIRLCGGLRQFALQVGLPLHFAHLQPDENSGRQCCRSCGQADHHLHGARFRARVIPRLLAAPAAALTTIARLRRPARRCPRRE